MQGRLIDHVRNSAAVGLEDLQVLVLDEADRLLEMGFAEEIGEIVKMAPTQRQTLLFSATMTDQVRCACAGTVAVCQTCCKVEAFSIVVQFVLLHIHNQKNKTTKKNHHFHLLSNHSYHSFFLNPRHQCPGEKAGVHVPEATSAPRSPCHCQGS